MKKMYKSKMSKGLIIVLVLLFLYIVYQMITEPVGFWIILICLIFVVVFFYNILSLRYTIENKKLIVTTKIFYHKSIDIKSIRKIEETNTIISAPANSFDRLEIIYNKFDSLIVSPENKQRFIEDLLAIHPEIEVKYKK